MFRDHQNQQGSVNICTLYQSNSCLFKSSSHLFQKGPVELGDCVAPPDSVTLLIRAVSQGSHLVPPKSSLSAVIHSAFDSAGQSSGATAKEQFSKRLLSWQNHDQ